MTFIDLTWQYRVRLNGKAENWRELLANSLRAVASSIDGRMSAAIEMQSTPYISIERRSACIKAGIKHSERLFESEIRAEAIEAGFKEIMPDLFEETEQSQRRA